MAHATRQAPLVTVKTKYQVTLPTSIRRKADVAVGDVLIDRELALALEDVRKGRMYGPFNSPAEMVQDMKKRVAERKKHRT